MPTATQTASTVTFQGIEVPAASVNPDAFFALTRRHRSLDYNKAYAGLGLTDPVELRKSDIMSGIYVRFVGQAVVSAAISTTMKWPYDLVSFKLTANGQTNLIDAGGCAIKAREFMQPDKTTDRGVSQAVGAGNVTQGTLSQASEKWGMGAGAAVAAGTYPIDLEWFIPVAEDPVDLSGALFLQTSSMDAILQVVYAQAADLFTVPADVTLTGNLQVTPEKYSIPVVGGDLVLPDLSTFHSIVSNRVANSLAVGGNEVKIAGQGAGKRLLRLYSRVMNGAAPQTPLAVTDTNYGPLSWLYGTSEAPETYGSGGIMRAFNEADYGSDIGGVFGWFSHEFATVNAFRDSVDMGQTSELRQLISIANGVALTNPAVEYVQELMFGAGD